MNTKQAKQEFEKPALKKSKAKKICYKGFKSLIAFDLVADPGFSYIKILNE